MATFTVERANWFRGKGSSQSKLLRPDGLRCCIGFVGQQCGVPDENLLLRPDIHCQDYGDHHHTVESVWPSWMVSGESDDIAKAYDINDNVKLTDEEREAKLIKVFAKHGDVLKFV